MHMCLLEQFKADEQNSFFNLSEAIIAKEHTYQNIFDFYFLPNIHQRFFFMTDECRVMIHLPNDEEFNPDPHKCK